MEQFATQASIELSEELEHQKLNHKNCGFSQSNLLSLLELDQAQESLSRSCDVQTDRSDLKPLSPSEEKRRKTFSTPRQSDRDQRSSSKIELRDKTSYSSEELQEVFCPKNKEINENTNSPSTNTDLGLGEHLFWGLLKIPDHYVFISSDQKALLNIQDSWFQSEADSSNSYARIPQKVSGQLISFHDQKLNSQGNFSCGPYGHHASNTNDQFQQWDCYSKAAQFIPYQYFKIPDDQKALLDESHSWFRGEFEPSNRYARIPPEVSQNLITFLSSNVKTEDSSQTLEDGFIKMIPELGDNSQESIEWNDNDHCEISNLPNTQQEDDPNSGLKKVHESGENQITDEKNTQEASSNTDERQGSEPKGDLNFVNLDQDSYNRDQNDLNMSSKVFEEDEHGDNYSSTPEPLSRPASFHDTSSDDIRTQNSSISHSPRSHHTRAESHVSKISLEEPPEEMFYRKFKSIYPEYSGSLRDFTWALVYIEWLLPQDENLDCKYWDDFVRVLASEYTNNIRYYGDPITGLEYYKSEPRQVLFCQNLLSPQTLQIGLSSLNKDEVENFREAFCKEPKEPSQSSNIVQPIKSSDSQKSLSQNFFGEDGDTPTDSFECIDESRLNESNDELSEGKISVRISHERTDNCPLAAHLQSWRQFLRKRKLAGTLSVDKVIRKRYCTILRNEHSNPNI